MITPAIAAAMQGGSFIRKMFEEGTRQKQLYGEENVFDFSLGNPDLEPPEACLAEMERLVRRPGIHKYMANAGAVDAREAVAAYESRRSGLQLTAGNVIMTVGAAGALNCIFKSILEEGDEVIIISPYFVEYLSYIGNYGGKAVAVPSKAGNFQLDLLAIGRAVTPRTRAVLLNSPNNPTGVVYPASDLAALNGILRSREHELKMETPILTLSDEPYGKLTYGVEVPSVLKFIENSVVVNSFSKSLSLPGERIGYIAIRPDTQDAELLASACAYTNRVLGFVNAPSLLQGVVAACLDLPAEVDIYRRRGERLYQILLENGYECTRPEGAFYLFPKTLIEDDMEFCRIASEHHILMVPGSGFGCPGHARLAYCVDEAVIERSANAFRELSKVFGHS